MKNIILIKIFFLTILFPSLAYGGSKALQEGICSTGADISVDTTNARVNFGSCSYPGGVSNVALYSSSNAVIGNNGCTIYSTGTINCPTISQNGSAIVASQWTTSDNNIYNNNSGKVGIGTTTPTSLMTIFNDTLTITGTNNSGIYLSSSGAACLASSGFGRFCYRNTGEQFADQAFLWRGRGYAFETTEGAWAMIIGTNSNVGIGINSNSPRALADYKLTVAQDSINDDFGPIAATGLTNQNLTISMGVDTTNNVGFITAANKGVGYLPLALNYAGGNVGIANISPAYSLDVTGGERITGQLIIGGTVTATTEFSSNTFVDVGTTGQLFTTLGACISGSTISLTLDGNVNLMVGFTGCGNDSGSEEMKVSFLLDGDFPQGLSNTLGLAAFQAGASGTDGNVNFTYPIQKPSEGSHLLCLTCSTSAGVGSCAFPASCKNRFWAMVAK